MVQYVVDEVEASKVLVDPKKEEKETKEVKLLDLDDSDFSDQEGKFKIT